MKTTTLKKKLITIIAISLFGLYLTASISESSTSTITITENHFEFCSDDEQENKCFSM